QDPCAGRSFRVRGLIRGNGGHRWPFDCRDVVKLEVQAATLGRDELEARVRLLEEALAMRLTDAAQPDLQDLERHLRQGEQVLIPMDALLHVDLRDRIEPGALQRVDK